MSTLDAALAYIGRGWPVLPCYDVDDDGVCTCWQREQCPSTAKHPRLDTGVKGARVEETTIRRWLERQWPNRCNLGIAAGRVSGLVIIDVDPRHNGFATLAARERELGALPVDTPRVRTGSGGLHIYLAHPGSDRNISNSASTVLGEGLDVRADGGYVVAPPSITSAGAYTWLPDCDWTVAVAPIPPGWLDRLSRTRRRPPTDTPSGGARGDGTLPLGLAAREFIEHGVAWGQQRMRALAATRNLLAIGTSVEDTIELVWQGLERSPQEPGKRAWTREDAEAIVADLDRTDAPPLEDTDADLAAKVRTARFRRRRLIAHAIRVG